jgi:hypothetical protein
MPSQPDDPLHYEMKVPPEPQSSKQGEDSAKQKPEHKDPDSDAPRDTDTKESVKDMNVMRGHHEPQAVRDSSE